jgi:colanic acid/amylovoran biosynthesis glycosyltransferase
VSGHAHRRLLYVLDRFPSDTLNFVYNEIRALEAEGFVIDIVSLMPPVSVPEEARDFLPRTSNLRPLSVGQILAAFAHYLLRRPLALLGLLFRVPLDNDSPRKVLKSLAHLVVGVAFAHRVRDRREHIHAHFAFKASLAALCASRLNGNRYSFMAHGSATVYPPSRYSLASKLRGAAFVVAVSDYNAKVIRELCPDLPADGIIVNRTGIRLVEFPLAEQRPRDEGPPRILCVASLYPIKNHETLIRACALLAKQGQEFRLELVGKDEGGRQAMLERLAAEGGIADRVIFHGVVDHGEIAPILAGAAACVLSSHSEGIPVSLMEAMAVGTPVLGPRVTGLPELIREGETGWLADPSRPEEFARALTSMLGDPARAADMAGGARRHIEQVFDMEANARSLAGHFGERLS